MEFIHQITKRHADDRDDDVGDGGPPLEDFDEKFQTEIIDQDIADSHKEISDNLCPAS